MGLKKNLAYNIKLMRLIKNASLEEFADEIGVSRTTLFNIEKGKGNITIETIEHISQNLEISPLSLLSDAGGVSKLNHAEVLLKSLKDLTFMSETDRMEALMLMNRLAELMGE